MRVEATNGLTEGQPAQPNQRAGATAAGSTGQASGPWSGQDTSTLSSTAQKVNGLKAELLAAPEVRHERVLELQKAVQTGSYSASDQQIAGAMFNELLAPTVGSR